MTARVCARPGCTTPLVRRKTEGDARWVARKYCSRPCAARFGPRKETANPTGSCPDPTELDECGDCGRAMHRSRQSKSCVMHAHHRALGLCRICRRLTSLKPEPEPAALLELFPDRWPQWHADAPCSQVDPELFFVEGRGGNPGPAKKVCASCPYTAPCLVEAMARDDEWGIYGGLTVAERDELRKELAA